MFDTSKRLALGVALTLPVVGVVAAPAHADPTSDPLPNTAPATTPTTSPTTTPTSAVNVCLAHSQSNDAVKRHEVPAITCFSSFADAMASVGITVDPSASPDTIIQQARAVAKDRLAANAAAKASAPSAASAADVSAASFAEAPLALHWDGKPNASNYLFITGTECTGQGINLDGGPWDNRIQYTTPAGCSKVKHYDGAMYTGSAQTTTPAVSLLTSLFMKTSSLTYIG